MPPTNSASVDADRRFPGGVRGPFSGRMRTERAAPAHNETLRGQQHLDPPVSALALTEIPASVRVASEIGPAAHASPLMRRRSGPQGLSDSPRNCTGFRGASGT